MNKQPEMQSKQMKSPKQVIDFSYVLYRSGKDLIAEYRSATYAARSAYVAEQERMVEQALQQLPVGELKNSMESNLRLNAITEAGLDNVGDILRAGRLQIESLPGVGYVTAGQVLTAAKKLKAALEVNTVVRFNIDGKPATQTELLFNLQRYELAERIIGPVHDDLVHAVSLIKRTLENARIANRPIRALFIGRERRSEAKEALAELSQWANTEETRKLKLQIEDALHALATTIEPISPWQDYTERAVVYNGLLISISGKPQKELSETSYLPAELAKRVHEYELDTSLLRASLRGYQAFGAKFALQQRRVILGDEMGLGKTIQALAVIADLSARGKSHFLVICPASVLVNWQQEIAKHTTIEKIWLLHGPNRKWPCHDWIRLGGIGLTTYGTVASLELGDTRISAIVVDETHKIKNPNAGQTRATCRRIDSADRALLMSGTPLENRVEEFKTLVGHLRPEIAATLSDFDALTNADAFRKRVAPVYLRRNQDDVLDELPEKTEVEHWIEMDSHAKSIYASAVLEKNMMLMRRAAYLTDPPRKSAKLNMLLDILREASACENKVIVFSYFLNVLERIHTATLELSIPTFQPLTGAVTGTQRQTLIDEFTNLKGPGVLISQIDAGGVGLNIQAASVVIIAEPQWKPSTESQAIARAFRMGQTRPVQVHRLLTLESVDEYMVDLLAHKSNLHEEYARKSASKESSPDAIDKHEIRKIVNDQKQSEREHDIMNSERFRLGINGNSGEDQRAA